MPINLFPSKPLLALGYGSLLVLAPLRNADAQAPTTVPSSTDTAALPDDTVPANSQDVSRSQVPTISQNPANPQPTNIPAFPQQPGNYLSPYTSSTTNPQSPQLTAPSLYVTGANDVSQISAGNALNQAFNSQASSGFYSSEETGPSYEHAPIERIRLGPFDLKAALVTSVVADDNLRTGGQGQGTGKKSDVSFTAIPALLLVYGLHDGQKGFASLTYAPTLSRFYHTTSQNREDQNVALNAIYPFQRLTLNFTEAYTQTSGVNQDSNTRTTQTSDLTTIGAGYEVDDKISLSVQLQEVVTDFSGSTGQGTGGGQGGNTTSINTNLSYRLSEKLTLGPNANFGWDKPKGMSKQTYEQAGVGVNYTPTEKIGLYAQGGIELRQSDQSGQGGGGGGNGDQTNPVFSAGIGYTPFDSTSLSLGASQSVRSSTAAAGQATANDTVIDTGVNVSVTQRLVQRFYLNLAFQYSHDEDKATANSAGTGSTSQDHMTYRPSISYAPTAWSYVAIYYQYLSNTSNTPGTGYNDNQVGISVSAQF